jgi:hypothetical protein
MKTFTGQSHGISMRIMAKRNPIADISVAVIENTQLTPKGWTDSKSDLTIYCSFSYCHLLCNNHSIPTSPVIVPIRVFASPLHQW